MNFIYKSSPSLFCQFSKDGADYIGGLMTATFNGSNITSVRVPTLSDEIAERTERLTAIVKVSANATRVSRMNGSDMATVQIEDDDGKLLLLIHVVAYCCQTIHVHSCLAFNLRYFFLQSWMFSLNMLPTM